MILQTFSKNPQSVYGRDKEINDTRTLSKEKLFKELVNTFIKEFFFLALSSTRQLWWYKRYKDFYLGDSILNRSGVKSKRAWPENSEQEPVLPKAKAKQTCYVLQSRNNKSRQEVNWRSWFHSEAVTDQLYQIHKYYDAMEWALEWGTQVKNWWFTAKQTVSNENLWQRNQCFISSLVFAWETLYIFYGDVSDNITGIMTLQWYYLNIEVIKLKNTYWISLYNFLVLKGTQNWLKWVLSYLCLLLKMLSKLSFLPR